MIINKKKYGCLVVFTPNQPELYNNRKRFFVSLNTLKNYIGENNAHKAIERIITSRTDKTTILLRKYGKIESYVK